MFTEPPPTTKNVEGPYLTVDLYLNRWKLICDLVNNQRRDMKPRLVLESGLKCERSSAMNGER
uniref:Uncharacterized protein n=1 Tax=Timema douglasi TaxID=61478 RepID=A0A7R8VLC8_TIMDO|nr:unnamed protein product [Timema douglasi]